MPMVGKLSWPEAIFMLICGLLALFPYRQVAFAGFGAALAMSVVLHFVRAQKRMGAATEGGAS